MAPRRLDPLTPLDDSPTSEEDVGDVIGSSSASSFGDLVLSNFERSDKREEPRKSAEIINFLSKSMEFCDFFNEKQVETARKHEKTEEKLKICPFSYLSLLASCWVFPEWHFCAFDGASYGEESWLSGKSKISGEPRKNHKNWREKRKNLENCRETVIIHVFPPQNFHIFELLYFWRQVRMNIDQTSRILSKFSRAFFGICIRSSLSLTSSDRRLEHLQNERIEKNGKNKKL